MHAKLLVKLAKRGKESENDISNSIQTAYMSWEPSYPTLFVLLLD